MSSEEKFKDLLKEKLEGKEFPFNPENWEKARELIDESRGKKRRLIPFILLCVGIFISGGLTFYFFNSSLEKEETTLTQQTPQPLPVPAEKQMALPPAPGAGSTLKPESPAVEQNTGNKAERTETTLNEQSRITESTSSSAHEPAMTKTTASKVIVTGTSDRHNAQTSGAGNAQSTAMLKKKSKQQSGQANTNSAQEKNAGATEETETAGNVSVNVKGVKTKQEPVKNGSVEDSGQALPEKGGAAEAPGKSLPVTEAVETPVKEQPQTPVVNPDPLAIAPAIVSPSVSPELDNKVDALAVAKPDTAAELRAPVPKNFFSIEGGGSFNLGWNDDKGPDANGINPLFGINYQREVSDKYRVSLGVHYTTVGNLGNYSNESSHTRYGFGSVSDKTVITPVKIHYLYFPLRLSYVINPTSSVGVGYHFGYLLTVNSKVENYSQQLNETSGYKSSKTRGYSEGFNSYDSQLSLFYRRRLFGDLSANAELFYGLSDVKNNTFFGSRRFERNSGIKFTLIYNIFKR